MFERFLYKKGSIAGVHTECPACKKSYLKSEEISRKEYRKRTEVYVKCICGCKYKYYFGI